MSLNNLGKLSGTIYQQDITLALGLVNTTLGTVSSPFLGCSKILGYATKTAGGSGFHQISVIPNGPVAIADVLAGRCLITAASNIASDTSTYTIYWCNSGFASVVSTVDPAAVGQLCLC
jgi:hypothetical protein